MNTFSCFTGIQKIFFCLLLTLVLASCGLQSFEAKSITDDATTTAADAASPIISPTVLTAVVSSASAATYRFTASGGSAPYIYSVVTPSGGTIDTKGQYSPPNSPGTYIVRVTDASGAKSDATVIVNPSIAINPGNNTRTVAYGSSLGIQASGGVPPYSFHLISGGGFVLFSSTATTTYYAPTIASVDSTATVRVTDSIGLYAETTLSLIQPAALAISPFSRFVTTGNFAIPSNGYTLYSFTSSGGYPPYVYSILSGPGSIDANSGYYTAPNDSVITPRTTVVRVTDAAGTTRDAMVLVQPMLQITPSAVTIAAGQQIRLDGIGGICAYNFSIVSGAGALTTIASTNTNYAQGSVACSAAYFVAPNTSGTTVIRVFDQIMRWADATITVTGTASGPSESSLTISPVTRIVSAASTLQTNPVPPIYQYTASGGVAPYTFSLVSGAGVISATTGIYNPPTDSSVILRTAIVRATDAVGAYRDSTIFIQPTLNALTTPIQPTNLWSLGTTYANPDFILPSTTTTRTVAAGAQVRIDGYGGICPFTYSLTAGVGQLNNFSFTSNNFANVGAACGLAIYNAPLVAESSVVRITDGAGNSANATINVVTDQLGARDFTYGSSGLSTFSFDTGDDYAKDAALDAAGNTVIAGYSYNSGTSNYDFAIARVLPGGALDPSFGTAGLVRIDVSTKNDYATSVAIQADGKIVVLGYCQSAATGYDFCITRLSSLGVLDNTFGTGGKATFQLIAGSNSEYAQALSIDAGGNIFIAGHCYNGGTNLFDLCVAKLTSAGALDTTFNTTGIQKLALAGNDYLASMLVASDGSVYLGGACSTLFCVAKFTSNGTLDASYGYSAGYSRVAAGANLSYTNLPIQMVQQSDGKIVFGGSAVATVNNNSDYQYILGRLTTDGMLDDFFGTDGRIGVFQSIYNAGTAVNQTPDYITNLILQSDGKIMGIGKTFGIDLNYDYASFRVTPDGSLDMPFGSSGRMMYSIPGSSANTEGAVKQSDGKVVIVGSILSLGKSKFASIRIYP